MMMMICYKELLYWQCLNLLILQENETKTVPHCPLPPQKKTPGQSTLQVLSISHLYITRMVFETMFLCGKSPMQMCNCFLQVTQVFFSWILGLDFFDNMAIYLHPLPFSGNICSVCVCVLKSAFSTLGFISFLWEWHSHFLYWALLWNDFYSLLPRFVWMCKGPNLAAMFPSEILIVTQL